MKPLRIERLLVGILVVIAIGIVFHAPLTVWLGTIAPQFDLVIKSWKELLMAVALVLLLVVARQRKMVNAFLSDRLVQIALIYAGLHFVTMAIIQNDPTAAGAGLLIDLRYVFYFTLVYCTLRMLPEYRRFFIWSFVVGAIVVIGFAVLQLLFLPKDILANIGYSKETISPYLTVDENPAYTRINSTLRGPNPLGAYAVIAASVLLAVGALWKLGKKGWWIACIAAVAIGMALGASYSRSSIIGAVVAITLIVVVSTTKTMRKRLIIWGGIGLVIVAVATFALRDTHLVSNLVWHDNPTTGATVDSNEGHADSLRNGTIRMLTQPLGAGIGSSGSASLLSDDPIIIENHYLLVAHEVGWIGLGLFLWLFVVVMQRLWSDRKSALALGVFASGAGLAVIGLLLPVWTDDTVSIIWWGLAAVAIATITTKPSKKKSKHAKATSN